MENLTAYERLGQEIGRLVHSKQIAYGNSFSKSGDVLRILYPNGIPPDQMVDALAIVRVVDKLFRLANDKQAFGESPWRDIIGYGICGAANDEVVTKPEAKNEDVTRDPNGSEWQPGKWFSGPPAPEPDDPPRFCRCGCEIVSYRLVRPAECEYCADEHTFRPGDY